MPDFFLKSGENSLFFRLFRGLFHHFAQKLAQFRGNFAHRRMEARRKIAVRGTVVRVAQAFLVCRGYKSAYVDGEFGGDTKDAVIAFQKARGLARDGVIGKNTWRKLIG